MSTHNICFHGEIKKNIYLVPHFSEARDFWIAIADLV